MSTNNPDSPDEIICPCSGTTHNAVEAMFNEGLDLDAISRRSGALSGCGGCEWDIGEFVKMLTEAQTLVQAKLTEQTMLDEQAPKPT